MSELKITAGQARALDAVIAHNCIVKRAAESLGLSHRTVLAHIEHAKLRMKARNQAEALLMWDRMRRAA
jgi:DNA-binding CsgD family transcriptional regulator